MALTKIPSELSSTTGIVDNSNATAITIDSNENVGIGTSSPKSAVDLGSGSSGNRQISWHSTPTTAYGNIWQSLNGARTIIANGLKGSSSVNNGFEASTSNSWARTAIEQDYGKIKFYTNAASATTYGTAYTPSERMRIDSSGNLLVGKTSAAGRSTAGIEARGDGVLIATKAGTVQYLNRTGSNGTILDLSKSGTTVGSISVTTTSTSYNTSSDYRLKENVVELTGATERLKQLNPSRFNFIADADTTVDGFLAHEVADVVPEAISGEKDAVDADGNPEYQGIDQSKLVPLLVATIQELEARITELENN